MGLPIVNVGLNTLQKFFTIDIETVCIVEKVESKGSIRVLLSRYISFNHAFEILNVCLDDLCRELDFFIKYLRSLELIRSFAKHVLRKIILRLDQLFALVFLSSPKHHFL